jgi:hypothetical protein
MLQHPLRRNCRGRCVRLPRPRLSPIRPWPVVVKQNPYDSANGHHVEHCGNAHLKDQVDQRLDSDCGQEGEHGTEEKHGGDSRPFRPGSKVTHRWTIAGLLTGAIVRRRPSKTRWPQAQRGQNHVGGSAGLVLGALIPAGAIFGLRLAANVRRRDRLEIIAKLATVLECDPAELLRVSGRPNT